MTVVEFRLGAIPVILLLGFALPDCLILHRCQCAVCQVYLSRNAKRYRAKPKMGFAGFLPYRRQ